MPRLSAEMGLKSKSRGKGVNRTLTVFKKEGSSIVSSDARLVLTPSVRCYASTLLSKFPVSNRERMGLTEFEAVKKMYDGVRELIRMESELQ